ncbi:MAG: hypothetical protein HUU55_04170 [Myxococcales bacterium]|nr:hypothetical protein [Myxococcales bacterium]
MKVFNRTVRTTMLTVGFFLAVGTFVGCGGEYVPRKDGICNPGRVWVPPQKAEDGSWQAGYCKFAE